MKENNVGYIILYMHIHKFTIRFNKNMKNYEIYL